MDADIPSMVKDGKKERVLFWSDLVRGSCKGTGDGKPQGRDGTGRRDVLFRGMSFLLIATSGRNKKPQRDRARARAQPSVMMNKSDCAVVQARHRQTRETRFSPLLFWTSTATATASWRGVKKSWKSTVFVRSPSGVCPDRRSHLPQTSGASQGKTVTDVNHVTAGRDRGRL